ncbi:pentapeptide repeat-containing protein [Frankia sp. Cppng1_Ct_nod]|uniref:WD40 domain-containing protein n=1 Tax=Frankia sp. Cppng1_Ct_nod TaxID=2897162 RepID=UPI0020254A9F|nr:pentapeptide repeat-containing protein [Frankia sp. Cppng1_Ct_nod]
MPFRRHPDDTGEIFARPDTFLTRVIEVARLRNKDATVTPTNGTAGTPTYLRVAVARPGTLVEQRPVGVYEHGADLAAVEEFAGRVHAHYAAGDQHLVSDLVYGGPRADDDLARAALRRGVRLVSFVEYQGLLDLRGYLARQTARLEADPLYPPALYVPQRLTRLDQPAAPPTEDALGEVASWLAVDGPRYRPAARRFRPWEDVPAARAGPPAAVPAAAPDPDARRASRTGKAHSVDELVAAHFMATGEETFDRAKFGYLLRSGRVVLLFDGFDELALRVSYERAADHLHTLLSAVDGNAKIVVSSRSQHFLNDDQVRTALGRNVERVAASRLAQLEDFTDGQIHAFLVNLFDRRPTTVGDGDQPRAACKRAWVTAERAAAARLALIRDIRDLLGLARNPRMLGFIAELDEERLRDVQAREGSIGSADLYKELLSKWLDFEENRTQPAGAAPTLTAAQRWAAVTALALRLWGSTERLISLSELTATTSSTLTTLADHGLDEDQAAHLVGSGSLLVRADDGGFTFIHSSVTEFLVAQHAAGQLTGPPSVDTSGYVSGETGTDPARPGALENRAMSPLMVDFFCTLAGNDVAIRWARIVTAGTDTSQAAQTNALAIARHLGAELIVAARLAGANLAGQDLSGRSLVRADLTGADLTDTRITDTDLTGADLTGARLDRAVLTDTRLTGADLTAARLIDTRLIGCDLTGAALDGGDWRRATLINCLVDPDTRGGPELAEASVIGRDRAVLTFALAAGPVRSVAFSPTDSDLLAYSSGNAVILADRPSGQARRVLTGHTGQVWSLAFSPDGTRIATGSDDGTVRIWDTTTGTGQAFLAGQTGKVRSVAFSLDGTHLATSSDNGAVRIWDTTTGTGQALLARHSGWVWQVAYTPDGTHLVTIGTDGARVWDTTTGTEQALRTGHDGPVQSLAYSPDGTHLATGSDDGTVHIWDAATGTRQALRAGHDGPVQSLAYSPDGTHLATAGTDGTVHIWDTTTGTEQALRTVHNDRVRSVAFSPDGTRIIAAGRAVRIWNTTIGTGRHQLTGHTNRVRSAAFSPDGTRLATASDDATVILWDAASGEQRTRLTEHSGPALAVAFSPDGTRVASGDNGGRVRLWAVAGMAQARLTDHNGPVWSLAFSPDGARLASASGDSTVRIWPLRGMRRRPQTLRGHKGPVLSVAFSPDGTRIATGGNDGTVRLWNADGTEDNLPFRRGTRHGGPVWSVAFSPDGTRIASGGDDGTLQVWAVGGDGHTRRTGHSGPVRSVAFSPDSTRVATVGDDGTIRLWNAAGGGWLAVLVALPEDGWAAFLPDGRYKLHGNPAGRFWWAVKLCRFEPGELDPHVPGIHRIPDDEPLPLTPG